MIFDATSTFNNYYKGNKTWAKIGEFIESLSLDTETGKHVIDGDDLFAFVSKYETRPLEGAEMEIHHTYTDIQILLSGEELIGQQPEDENLTLTKAYDSDNDIAFYEATEFGAIKLRPGVFAAYYPKEYHMPQLQVAPGIAEPVMKVVVKVKADLL